MNIQEWIAEANPEALLAEGFEDAILGICERTDMEPVIAYDRDKCIQILMKEFEGTIGKDEDLWTAAVEYFEYNVIGSYVGKYTPVFITLPDPDFIDEEMV